MNTKRIDSLKNPNRFSNRRRVKIYFLAINLMLAGIASTMLASAQTSGVQSVPTAALETIQVPASGEAVTFKTSFERGEIFLLKASGAATFGDDTLDAKYDGASLDNVAGTDVGIDVGLKELRQLKGVVPGRQKWFGNYRADHTYYMTVTGTGEPLTLKLLNGGKQAGQGSIAVSLFRVSPMPQFSQPLETLLVPVLQQTEQTTMTTSSNTIYLLRCAGDAKVGGGGVGRGDADYMDYKADGTGKVDVGDFNTDYGLGVDEADLGKSPRQNWWGPWRQDHTYYQLFAGTGQPIHFYYYDVKGGYGDNSPTDRLKVTVFPVP
jgi:hypothetical protein